MNVLRNVLIFCLLASSYNLMGQTLEKCLASAAYHSHRLDKENTLSYCFNKYKEQVSKKNCFSQIKKYKVLINNQRLLNQTNQVCFFEAGVFNNLKDCLNETKRFNSAVDHDDAVFYCYQSFQDSTSTKQCLDTANKMIFAAKKEYLKNHCLTQ